MSRLATLRHRPPRARASLVAALVALVTALGSCGQTSTSHADDGSAGVAAAAAGTSSAGTSGAGTSGAGASDVEANSAGRSDDGGRTGEGGAASGSIGGAEGGAGGDSSAGGAGGADSCVDVCELYGEACCAGNANCIRADASCVIDVYDKVGRSSCGSAPGRARGCFQAWRATSLHDCASIDPNSVRHSASAAPSRNSSWAGPRHP